MIDEKMMARFFSKVDKNGVARASISDVLSRKRWRHVA